MVVEGEPLKLIETVAEIIANGILESNSGESITGFRVVLVKPDPPIPGHYTSVSVDITIGRFRVNRSFISIGSNIGDRLHCLVGAVRALHSHGKLRSLSVSSIYETEPVGYVDQCGFL